MPSFKTVATAAVVSLLMIVGYNKYQQRNGG
jgi:hypothetical protein